MLAVLACHRDAAHRIGPAAPATLRAAAHRVWDAALEIAAEHGLRNAQTTLVPPAGTVSLILDCETTGIEPYYAFAGHRQFAGGDRVQFESRALADGRVALGYSTRTVAELTAYAHDHGHLHGAAGLRPGDALVGQTASGPEPISIAGHLAMVAAVQPLLSGGVSKTLNLPTDTTPETIEQIFHTAWSMGLKSISVYRQGSKLAQRLSAIDV